MGLLSEVSPEVVCYNSLYHVDINVINLYLQWSINLLYFNLNPNIYKVSLELLYVIAISRTSPQTRGRSNWRRMVGGVGVQLGEGERGLVGGHFYPSNNKNVPFVFLL